MRIRDIDKIYRRRSIYANVIRDAYDYPSNVIYDAIFKSISLCRNHINRHKFFKNLYNDFADAESKHHYLKSDDLYNVFINIYEIITTEILDSEEVEVISYYYKDIFNAEEISKRMGIPIRKIPSYRRDIVNKIGWMLATIYNEYTNEYTKNKNVTVYDIDPYRLSLCVINFTSPSLYNSFAESDIETIKDFISASDEDLNKVYGIGPKKLEEIKDIQHHIIYVINRLEIRKDLEEREDIRNGRRK